jgi:nitrous oxide reductase accessory protein NosL
MKKLIAVLVFCIGLSFMSHAQDTTRNYPNQQKSTNKGQAKSMDKKLNDKMGPNGETIYMTTETRYYWIDDKGERHYVEVVDLKPVKPKQ